MRTIRLTDNTSRALAELAIFPFQQTDTRGPDGLLHVPISDDVRIALERHRESGESDDDLVMRLVRFWRGAKPS